jgi:hypothetical protein
VQPSHVLAATEICARARRGAREPGLEHRRGRYRTLSCRLEKACKCAM